MTAERWTLLEEIFHQARKQPEALHRLCGEDAQLEAEVQALLDADAEASRLSAKTEARPADLAGRRAGNYRLDSLLGTGGMGAVYLAHRCDGQFQRQVALKILGANLRNEFFTERFALERQLLASLDHRNITRLLDSGVSDAGDPYLVLEYVDGKPIDRYCDEQLLPVNARVRLFRQVCEAVAYAHSRHVIHRDLKPSNIMVSADGAVKLLDFGTAKLLESSDTDATSTNFRMMTPRYASPEQLRGETLTSASDVYSLGIVLYELLTGAWPFGDPQSVVSGLERAVRTVEPRHPGSVLTDPAAVQRGGSTKDIVKELNGDVWKVIRKAIDDDPRRRYPSVEDFSRDLERYLSATPVLARPKTRLRRRTAWASAAAVLIIAGGVFFWLERPVPPPPSAASIAVLPFRNLSGNPANQYFSDGLTDEVTDALSRIGTLRVVAHSSAFEFRGRTGDAGDIRDIGRQLHVANILEGSVERDRDRLRIAVRLERVSDGVSLWSNTYERKTADWFAIQPELASGIAGNLRVAVLHVASSQHIPNEQAHDALMRGRFELEQNTPESLQQAEQDFERAIALDPDYANAYLSLGAAIFNRASARLTRQNRLDMVRARELHRKALDLDPALPVAHANLAIMAMQYDWDWQQAERELQTATALGPNSVVESAYALLRAYQGRFAEADEHLRRSQDLDPLGVINLLRASLIRFLEGRYPQAIEESRKIVARYPKMMTPALAISGFETMEGRPDLALEALSKMNAASPPVRLYKAMAEARAGDRQGALALVRPYESNYQKSDITVEWIALVYGFLGDENNTLLWLNRSADRRESQVLFFAVNPVFQFMRHHPQFVALEKRMGLAP